MKRSLAFTMAPRKALAFTMAEILLSLTIIGVVAAITLPSLMANINERTWNTQRKALYARMSQALSIMPQMGGYGKVTEEGGSITEDTAAEAFLTEGLSKVLKINNICDSEHLADCGIVSSYTNMTGSVNSWPTKLSELNPLFTGSHTNANGSVHQSPLKDVDTKVAAFETLSGESVALYYNNYCYAKSNDMRWKHVAPYMCANFVYDLNGVKGPNTVGKDIGFITALYSTETSVVAPMPLKNELPKTYDQLSAAKACADYEADSRLPNIEELMGMFYNKMFTGFPVYGQWSSTVSYSAKEYQGLTLNFSAGVIDNQLRTYKDYVRCVKRQ